MTAYGVRISDWSSDVCSSDLTPRRPRSARLASFPSFPSFPIPHSRSMPTLNGQTLFITGASRGIGLAIALRAARDGANVAIAAKSDVPNPKLPGTIHTAAQAVDEAGGRGLALKCDIREEDQVRAAVAATEIGRAHV